MTRTLSEAESKRVLAAHGVPVLQERLAATPDDAVAAADALGYPVVVKACGAGIAHKTERGLVHLGLADATAVRTAATEVLGAVDGSDGSVDLLVAPMVRGNRELIAGVHDDPQFGRCVMVGLGGILAEAIGDVAFRLVPLEPVDVDEMLDDLGAQAVLGEFRGELPVDRAALADVLLGLSRLAEADTSVVSVDVNPLVVVDGRPVAVDALVEVTA
ncbi:MAG TPA: acetate--CoA ligase family protein [Acidimicrobiia bacterium]|nr:acetate--CoA ligase family protein [Acidimicrobiia bacterium]